MATWPVDVKLDAKAIHAIVGALDIQTAIYRARLDSGSLTEDEESEVGNDLHYVEALCASLQSLLHRPADK